ncbi:ABC transporter ATP-binding protein, partial [Cutibacterium acnes]
AHAAYGALEGSIVLRGLQAAVERYSAIDAAGRIGSVSQDAETGTVMDIVEDELAFGPENLLAPPELIDERIDAALTAVGLPVRETRARRVAQLSGGQQQRVAIAAVHAMQPELFVFDDAAANLDAEGAERVAKTLRRLHREGHALLTAAPRWEGVEGSERVIVLSEGRIIADGPPADVLSLHRET